MAASVRRMTRASAMPGACRTSEQEAAVGAFLKPVDEQIFKVIDQHPPFLKTQLSHAGSLPVKGEDVDVLYVHDRLADDEFTAVVNSDLKWAVLSFLSVVRWQLSVKCQPNQ